jgi:hypothetical protein
MTPVNYNIIKTNQKVEMIKVLLEVLESKNGSILNHPYHTSSDNIGGIAKQKLYELLKSIKVEEI